VLARSRIRLVEFEMIERLRDTDIRVLLYLYAHEYGTLNEIRKELHMSFGTVYRVKGNLKEMGLIEEKRIGNSVVLSLTPLGNYVAKKLLEIDRKLRDAYSST